MGRREVGMEIRDFGGFGGLESRQGTDWSLSIGIISPPEEKQERKGQKLMVVNRAAHTALHPFPFP